MNPDAIKIELQFDSMINHAISKSIKSSNQLINNHFFQTIQ